MTPKKILLLFAAICISLLFAGILVSSTNSSLEFLNSTSPANIFYDRIDTTFSNSSGYNFSYGSDSYMDYNPTTGNLFLSLCHPNLAVGSMLDIVYYTQSRNITASVLDYPVKVYNTTRSGSENCTFIDVDFSSIKALYPGYVMPVLTTGEDEYNLSPLSTLLNGSYKIGVRVEAPPKRYYLSTQQVYDQGGMLITRSAPYLLTSFINSSSVSVAEARLSPGDTIEYEGSMLGGERVYVNGLSSLQIRMFDPCAVLNESGYYILNSSQFDLNRTCIVINDTTDLVVNFAGEVIDGDNNTNGSLADNSCPVLVLNSRNVSIESLFTQQFKYGVCVVNSTVDIIGFTSVYNIEGAYIYNRSNVRFIDMSFESNNNTDINAFDNSTVTLINVNFSTATLYSTFRNAIVKSVLNPPEPPDIENIKDIDQYIEYRKTTDKDSWAQIKFHYTLPLPNNVVADNISIFRFNGTFTRYNITTYNNLTNTTTVTWYRNWTRGVWTQLYTLVSTSEQFIIGPNMTNFSVFAPFGFETENEQPIPTPEPLPVTQPKPSAGFSPGEGGEPAGEVENIPIFPKALFLNLSLPENMTLMQGEPGEVFFTLKNLGNVTAYNITIMPEVRKGWDFTNYSTDILGPTAEVNSSFLIAPYEKAPPALYNVPVTLTIRIDGRVFEVIRDIININVIPRTNLSRIRIIEYPPVIIMPPYSSMDISFLVENIGDTDLKNITIKYYPVDCLANIIGSNDIGAGETKVFAYVFESDKEAECSYNLKFFTGDKLVGFAPVRLVITEKARPFYSNFRFYILVLILSGWTVLTFNVLRRMRKK